MIALRLDVHLYHHAAAEDSTAEVLRLLRTIHEGVRAMALRTEQVLAQITRVSNFSESVHKFVTEAVPAIVADALAKAGVDDAKIDAALAELEPKLVAAEDAIRASTPEAPQA